MDLGLKDRVALVTAASQGMGRAVADELAREGMKLLVVARNQDRLAQVREELLATGAEVEVLVGDVSHADGPARMVDHCLQRFGRLDVLFASSGGPSPGTCLEMQDQDFATALELNLMSVVRLCQAAVPPMKQAGWGRIIALTSISVLEPVAGLVLSNTARAGAQGFLKSLANEVGAHGITVNNVCPGYTATERLEQLAKAVSARDSITEDEVRARWAASIPVGRLGRPEEVAAVVAFLASERASFLHGTTQPVDGGAVRSLL